MCVKGVDCSIIQKETLPLSNAINIGLSQHRATNGLYILPTHNTNYRHTGTV